MSRNRVLWHEHILRFTRTIGTGLLDLVYPATCLMCDQPADPADADFCVSCRAALVADAHARCPRCAATVGAAVALDNGCTHCRNEEFAFDLVLRLGPYEGVLREAILTMKHAGGELLAECLGLLWAKARESDLRACAADVIIPVPLHWWRRLARRYNQSEALAASLGEHLGLPCRPGWLRRIHATPFQTRQTPAQRRENLRKVFRACGEVNQRTVLLVDDVLTTGSTASEAARVLKQHGAKRVVVAVLARSHA